MKLLKRTVVEVYFRDRPGGGARETEVLRGQVARQQNRIVVLLVACVVEALGLAWLLLRLKGR